MYQEAQNNTCETLHPDLYKQVWPVKLLSTEVTCTLALAYFGKALALQVVEATNSEGGEGSRCG